jgi:hypothetical protein
MTTITAVAWAIGFLGFLVVTQRWFQRQLQVFLAALTRNPEVTVALYALMFAPGAAVHELSHWVMAFCLRVRAISFSLVPKRGPRDQLRLGYVETERTDPVRSALIGVAPLVTGVVLLSLLTLHQLALEPIVEAGARFDVREVLRTVALLPGVPDVGLWLYLVVAISNTMLPSAADRSAWLPAGLIVVGLGAIIALSGFEVRDQGWVSAQAQAILPRLSAVFGLTASLNLVLGLAVWGAGSLVLRARRLASS